MCFILIYVTKQIQFFQRDLNFNIVESQMGIECIFKMSVYFMYSKIRNENNVG
jgi:hypothetical protein